MSKVDKGRLSHDFPKSMEELIDLLEAENRRLLNLNSKSVDLSASVRDPGKGERAH